MQTYPTVTKNLNHLLARSAVILLLIGAVCAHGTAYAMEASHESDPKNYGSKILTLHKLVEQNQFQEIHILLRDIEHGDMLHEIDHNGNTALHLAAWYGFNSIAISLIRCGAHPDIPNHGGETPLDLAKRQDQWSMVKILSG